MEYAARVQSRLAFRRLRDLRAVFDGRRRAASVARSKPVPADTGLCRLHHCDHAAGLGYRRPAGRGCRRLFRTQAHHDACDPDLFARHRPECPGVGLDILRAAPLPGRSGDRLGMGHRGLDRLGTVAGPRPRPRRRPHAGWTGHRLFRLLARVGVHRNHGAECVAGDVPARHSAGPVDAVASHRHSGISVVGTGQ